MTRPSELCLKTPTSWGQDLCACNDNLSFQCKFFSIQKTAWSHPLCMQEMSNWSLHFWLQCRWVPIGSRSPISQSDQSSSNLSIIRFIHINQVCVAAQLDVALLPRLSQSLQGAKQPHDRLLGELHLDAKCEEFEFLTNYVVTALWPQILCSSGRQKDAVLSNSTHTIIPCRTRCSPILT